MPPHTHVEQQPNSPHTRLIEVRVRELRQLFNLMDPSPFQTRDLDPGAERFIVDWAKELPNAAPLGLMIYVDGPEPASEEARVVEASIQQYFGVQATVTRRGLRELFRRGRISLLIALFFLIGLGELANLVAGAPLGRVGNILREGLLIGGWVAMWRPIEIFLYDWWPIRAQARLFGRLSAMPVRIRRAADTATAISTPPPVW